ncbi:hypothetical protein TI03_05890, partial [Achromatium sp. WMS1]
AYSDYDVATIIRAAGADVGYFVKPFSHDEVLQMATRSVIEWNKAQELEALIRIMSTINAQGNNIQTLLKHLLNQICIWLGTDSAAFLTRRTDDKNCYEFKFGVGRLQNAKAASGILKNLKSAAINEVQVHHDLVVMPMHEFGCTVGILGKISLTPDRMFLLKLFAEHAHNALRNSQMQSKLLEIERMSAIGSAVSFITHDLRNLIGSSTQLINMLKVNDESVCSREKLFDILTDSLDAAFSLVDDIVGYTQHTITITPQDTDIRSLLEDLVMIWRLRSQDYVDIELVADVTCICYADHNRFMRVLNNLIKNACEAAMMNPKQKGHVLIKAQTFKKTLVLSVADNGPGIPDT